MRDPAVEELLGLLREVYDALDDRYDYATDTGEEPFSGAGYLLQKMRVVLRNHEMEEEW